MLDYKEKFIGEGLTYDDVLLVPAYSENLPHEVNLKSKFTRNIAINTPIISAAMDTVTEHDLAISIAQQGGIGVIHKNMSIQRQANEVRKVKRSESGMILDPITLNEEALVGDALRLMAENKIGGIPVISKERKLKGIVTNRDLRFEKKLNKKIADVMTTGGGLNLSSPIAFFFIYSIISWQPLFYESNFTLDVFPKVVVSSI